MKASGIYKILNTITGKFYIGSAKNIAHRWRVHRSDLKLQKHGSIIFQRSWDLHGEKIFKFEIIELCEKEKLIEREQFWLDWFKPYDPNIGYNINKFAGSRLGTKHTEEFKAKRSAMMKGKKQSPELIAKRAAANTGNKRSEETKAKMRLAQNGHIGLIHTEEAKIKIGEGSKITRAKEREKRYATFDAIIKDAIVITNQKAI